MSEIQAVNVPTVILSFCREKKASFRATPFRTDQAAGPSAPLSTPFPPHPHPIHILIFHTLEKMLFQMFLLKTTSCSGFQSLPSKDLICTGGRWVAADVSDGGDKIMHRGRAGGERARKAGSGFSSKPTWAGRGASRGGRVVLGVTAPERG